MVNFSVITATLGRQTLPNAIRSVLLNLREGDEYIVAFDGPIQVDLLDETCIGPAGQVLYMNSEPTPGGFGNPQRTKAIGDAAGTHVVFVDDDDELAPGALDRLRPFCEDYPGCVILQPMRSWRNGYPPNMLLHEKAHYCLCMGVYPLPVISRFLPSWDRPAGDSDWLAELLKSYSRVSINSEEPTYLVRPYNPDAIVPAHRRIP